MRKYRSWLMGLGIGLIIGASMLQLILVAQEQATIVADEPLTREQLDTAARKAGLVLLPVGEAVYSQAQLDAKVQEAVAAAQNGEDTPKATDNTDHSESNVDAEEAEQPEPVTLYVRPKMSLTQVAIKLEELGVIDNADDFIAKARPISKELKVGNSVFSEKMTYQAIMDELTRKKN